jgi:hypothetical protein
VPSNILGSQGADARALAGSHAAEFVGRMGVGIYLRDDPIPNAAHNSSITVGHDEATCKLAADRLDDVAFAERRNIVGDGRLMRKN